MRIRHTYHMQIWLNQFCLDRRFILTTLNTFSLTLINSLIWMVALDSNVTSNIQTICNSLLLEYSVDWPPRICTCCISCSSVAKTTKKKCLFFRTYVMVSIKPREHPKPRVHCVLVDMFSAISIVIYFWCAIYRCTVECVALKPWFGKHLSSMLMRESASVDYLSQNVRKVPELCSYLYLTISWKW